MPAGRRGAEREPSSYYSEYDVEEDEEEEPGTEDKAEEPGPHDHVTRGRRSKPQVGADCSECRRALAPDGTPFLYNDKGDTKAVDQEAPKQAYEWVHMLLPDGKTDVWRNIKSDELVFSDPTKEQHTQPAKTVLSELKQMQDKQKEAAAWKQATHEGRTYFYNSANNATQWGTPDILREVTSSDFTSKLASLKAKIPQKSQSLAAGGIPLPPSLTLATTSKSHAARGHHTVNLKMATIHGDKEVQKEVAALHGLLASARLGTSHNASYHLVFSKFLQHPY